MSQNETIAEQVTIANAIPENNRDTDTIRSYWKTVYKMMYLYTALMAGWQIRWLKEHNAFEFTKDSV